MPCFHPIEAFRPRMPNEDGKRPLLFSYKSGMDADPIEISCGQCVGCRLERSRQWAIRCMHEASLHENNCFLTLTFSPEALNDRPNKWSLDVRDFQLFMKRLRKKYGKGIRFYHCGEYGENNKRPHYHACIFGFDFPDKELWKETKTGNKLYVSKSLEELWPFGFSTIGEVTFESAAYVARYIMKKITGDAAEFHYEWTEFDDLTGEIGETYALKPEYTTMSRRPGIGKDWFDKYSADVYPHDYVVVNGVKMRPPKYYDNQLKLSRPFEFDEVKHNRELNGEKHVDNNTPDRLYVREQCQIAKLNLLPRDEA